MKLNQRNAVFGLLLAGLLSSSTWAQRGEVPEGKLFGLTVPVSNKPTEDNAGAPLDVLAALYAKTGANLTGLRYSWAKCESTDPGERESKYVWPDRSDDPFMKIDGLQKMVSFDVTPPAWAKDLKQQDKERYWMLLERFVTGAARDARTNFGAHYFHVPGNEPSLASCTDKPIYKPEYESWYHWYMDTAVHVSKAVKRDSPDNQVVGGALVVGDEAHVASLYKCGAKEHFDVIDIHAYGDKKQHVSMKQIMETHATMEKFGDGHKKIYLGEGWSCFPLPKHIDGNLTKKARHTRADCEHYWETIQVGWMNIITPRPGEYDPAWMLGAKYFTFCDLIEGRFWRDRAVPQRDDKGNITHYLVDGYPKKENELGPFFRPWGIVDIDGKPKGNVVENIPPYIPKYAFRAELVGEGDAADRRYKVVLTMQNQDKAAMVNTRFGVYGRTGGGSGKAFEVKSKLAGRRPRPSLKPGDETVAQFDVRIPAKLPGDREEAKRVRLYGECRYRWARMPYYADAWGPVVELR